MRKLHDFPEHQDPNRTFVWKFLGTVGYQNRMTCFQKINEHIILLESLRPIIQPMTYSSPRAAVSQVFQRSGHSPLAPTHQVALSKLERHPPPRGFEEFFAKLAADPLVQVHSRNQNSIQFPVSWETNMSRKPTLQNLQNFRIFRSSWRFSTLFLLDARCRIVNLNGLRNLAQRAYGNPSRSRQSKVWGHSCLIPWRRPKSSSRRFCLDRVVSNQRFFQPGTWYDCLEP